MVRSIADISQLTVDERFGLIAELWDSLRNRIDGLPLSDTERAVIDERRVAHRSDPASAIAWETVRAELAADQTLDDAGSRHRARG